jgi:hypothetical protein
MPLAFRLNNGESNRIWRIKRCRPLRNIGTIRALQFRPNPVPSEPCPRSKANLVPVELHHINIVSPCRLSRRSGWSTRSRIGGRKDRVGGHVIALVVNRKRFNIVASVREGRVDGLHPISILLECFHVGKWLCLRREGCVQAWLTLGSPLFSALYA